MPSCGQPTSKAGHSAEQKVTKLLFFISNDRFCALDLKSEKWLVIRDKGVEVVCPMITEKYTESQKSTQRAKMVPALTQTQQIDKQTTNAKWPPTTQHWVFFNFHSILPAECSQSQLHPQLDAGPWPYAGLNPVTRASRLPSMIPGLGLTLDLSRTNTGVQISLLLVRKPLLPGECYSSQLKGSRTSPQMFCPESESPKLREQGVHGNAKA